MSSSAESRSHLEIGHVLFMDVVGYSKLLMNEQRDIQEQLTQVVRATEQFRVAETTGKLIRLPTGDGMALVFFNSPEAPVRCALEISEALQSFPHLKLRMGIHSGPVSGVTDVNERSNIAGPGVNTAQRVMDCGDAGHILLSKRVADDLAQDGQWRPQLYELGECRVKHGVGISIVNLYTAKLGNPELPAKLRLSRKQATTSKVKRKGLFIAGGVLLTVLLALLLYKLQPSRYSTARDVAEKSIAVLPLENLSEEKENAYFADGIQDELLANLSKIRDLKVISRTSVMQYKTGITRNLKEIAQQLGVTTIVEGSVRRSGNHVRVTVQLIDAVADRHLWAHNYDRTLADALVLEGELATEIAAGVGATLSPQEKARVEATPTKNTAAYDAYLRGRAFASDQLVERAKAEETIKSFQEAVELDPTFARAWASLSIAYGNSYWLFKQTAAGLAAASEALDRAIALEPNLPETHLAIGYYHYHIKRDFPGALTEFELAEQGLPNNVDVLEAIGLIQRRLGHWDEAIASLRRAVELDPRNRASSVVLATTCNAARRFPEAIAAADHILAWEPTNTDALEKKITAFWAMGNLDAAESILTSPGVDPLNRGLQALFRRRYAEAAEIFSKAAVPDTGGFLLASANLGLIQQRVDDVAASRATYQRMRDVLQREFAKGSLDRFSDAEPHSLVGIAAAALGDASEAIAEGEKAVAMRPASEDPFEGPGREEDMARIYALLGDAGRATSILERLLQTRYGGSLGLPITPALLQIDPIWDPIRNDLRFQKLLDKKAP
jgi:TolB-like protein/Flp pilus assembly protein TadD